MKRNIFLLFILFVVIAGQSQTPRVPTGKPGQVQLPTPKLRPLPDKVAFEAVISTEQPNPRSPLRFDAVRYNDGNSFSSSQNAFIAPSAGLYFFSVNLSWNGYGCGYVGGSVSVSAIKNTRESLQTINELAPHSSVGGFSTVLTFSSKLSAGDKITIAVVNILCTAGGGSTAVLYNGNFSGYRVYAD